MELPDLPLDEYQACLSQPLQAREIVYSSIAIAYGASRKPLTVHIAAANSFIQDTFAFVVIVYSARGLSRTRSAGVPSLLGNIVENATSYFLIIFTNHLVVILFELFAHVSTIQPTCPPTHSELHTGSYRSSSFPRGESRFRILY